MILRYSLCSSISRYMMNQVTCVRVSQGKSQSVYLMYNTYPYTCGILSNTQIAFSRYTMHSYGSIKSKIVCHHWDDNQRVEWPILIAIITWTIFSHGRTWQSLAYKERLAANANGPSELQCLFLHGWISLWTFQWDFSVSWRKVRVRLSSSANWSCFSITIARSY